MKHNDDCVIDRPISTNRRELKEATALVPLQYAKKSSSEGKISAAAVLVSVLVGWFETQDSQSKNAVLKRLSLAHTAGLPSTSATIRAWSVPDSILVSKPE